eukprot:TRINITY_DN17639_c0_g2_i1.p1 TRINITY_DN17639_c0_g2~~TRINITY_DN17639_c0_g2_i1.p1  ORF type:complete len:284 (+),score=67.43 TRINITY_DN17639_c0_g2_i1:83-934(+)
MCGPASIEAAVEGQGSCDLSPKEQLEAKEALLTQHVPDILECLNGASEEVNELERRASQAQGTYKRLLAEWQVLYDELRAQHGGSISGAVDQSRLYFEAARTLRRASAKATAADRAAEDAKGRLMAAELQMKCTEDKLKYGAHDVELRPPEQEMLSHCTAVLAQRRSDLSTCSEARAQASKALRKARAQLQAERERLGAAGLAYTKPRFRLLHQLQAALANEQQTITSIAERILASKAAYSSSLHELDRISESVHEARRQHQVSFCHAEQLQAATEESALESC